MAKRNDIAAHLILMQNHKVVTLGQPLISVSSVPTLHLFPPSWNFGVRQYPSGVNESNAKQLY